MRRIGRLLSACAMLVACPALPRHLPLHHPLQAQVPYHLFSERTQVARLRFSFPDGQSFSESRLLEQMVLNGPGVLHKIQGALSFFPFVSGPAALPFAVLDLQRDVARLRRFYADNGFIGTAVRYEVAFDPVQDRVSVDMIVSEGRPIRVRSVRSVAVDLAADTLAADTLAADSLAARPPREDSLRAIFGDPARALPKSLLPAWRELLQRQQAPLGKRFNEAMRAQLVSEMLSWWMDRGWAYARAQVETSVDSADAAVDLTVLLEPGPRARVSEIAVVGNRGVSDAVIRRALPFREGDWFSARKLADGQQRLFGLDLLRLVLIDVTQPQARDSTVRVRVRVEESPPRLATGEVGYVSEGGGITGRAEWVHRNFAGGARSLRLSTILQTGAFSLTDQPQREYGLTLSYRRPFTFHPRVTLSLAPYARYRDNLVDRSREAGAETTLLYELGSYRYLTFQHRYASRQVLDYRLGSANTIDLQTLRQLAAQGALDSLSRRIERSAVSVSATLGRFDPTLPRRTLQASPQVELTTPAARNAIEFSKVELPFLAFLPLPRGFGLAARARFGRVYPFGKTLRVDSVAGLLQAARLRDALLTAGGTASARGWGNGLLGPKILNLVFRDLENGDSATVVTDGYLPGAGLARSTASVELRTPFPGLGPVWGLHAFVDAGRVWTPDARFRGKDPYDEQRWFFAAGGGVDVATLVGPVRVSVGYKLNPSPLDLRDATAVFEAIADGRDIATVPASNGRRLHLHVALGQVF